MVQVEPLNFQRSNVQASSVKAFFRPKKPSNILGQILLTIVPKHKGFVLKQMPRHAHSHMRQPECVRVCDGCGAAGLALGPSTLPSTVLFSFPSRAFNLTGISVQHQYVLRATQAHTAGIMPYRQPVVHDTVLSL